MNFEMSQNNKEDENMAANTRDPGIEPVSDSNRSFVLEAGPIRPVLTNYPTNFIGARLYRFQQNWYSEHKWLEYSISKDAAYCFHCRCFATLGK